MDFYVVLERAGNRVARRRRARSHIGKYNFLLKTWFTFLLK